MLPVEGDRYVRRARLRRVVDGDTVDLDVDNGFYSVLSLRVRLLDVDTPELNAREATERRDAVEARAFVHSWMIGADDPERFDLADMAHGGADDFPLLIRTKKADSFGRWLAYIWRPEDDVDLSTALRRAGFDRP